MKSKITLMWLASLLFVFIMACSDKNNVPDPDVEEENDLPVEVSMLDRLTQSWDIDTAYHKGQYDASSTGKEIAFMKGGSYNFNGSFTGSWYFNLDSTRVLIDQGTSFAQDWEVVFLSEDRFVADFNSPFTGGASTWIMHKK